MRGFFILRIAGIKRNKLLPECENVKWNLCVGILKRPNVDHHSNKTCLYDYHFQKWRGNVFVILA